MFRSSHFWFLVTFGNKVMKIQKYYIIFVYLLQGKMEKKGKENHGTKVTKIPKTKRRKCGMNEIIIDDQTIHMYTKWSSKPILIHLIRFENFME